MTWTRQMPRLVQTLLFTDVVGSTDQLRSLGDFAWADLLDRHHAAVRAVLAAHGGIEVDTAGDGFLARFDAPTAAVRAAASAVRAVGALGLQIRAGLHTGEVELVADRPSGFGVHLAARVMGRAGGDEVLVSATLRELVAGSGMGFTDRGCHELKGFSEPWRLYALDLDSFEIDVPEPIQSPGAGRPGSWAMPLPAPVGEHAAAAVPLVGRDAEWVRAHTARRAALVESQRRVVLLSGEPGVGKSRFAAAVATAAAAEEGAVVLYGRCAEGAGAPYRPWVEALGHLVAHCGGDVLAVLPRRAQTDLAGLLPAVATRAGARPGADDETGRYQLFTAVSALVEAVCAARPLVLVLDDLQWADRFSLLLLRHVVTASPTLPLLVAGIYRDTDPAADHPLTPVLAGLYRDAGVERIALGGLDDSAVLALLRAVAGDDLDDPDDPDAAAALAAALRRQTNGNPFFTAELVRSLVAQHHGEEGRWRLAEGLDASPLPDSVRAIAAQRVAGLGEAGRATLAVAGVLGAEFELGVLAAVLDEPEEDVLDRLDIAVRAAVIREVAGDADRYAFVHAVVRHVLLDELGAARRRRWHRRMADVQARLATPRNMDAEHRVRLSPGERSLARFTLAVLRHTLDRGSAPAVAHALDLVERAMPGEPPRLLPELLSHPDERVRLDVLNRVERLELRTLLPQITARLPYEGSSAVRGASLRTIAALDGATALDLLAPALAGRDPVVRRGAIAGLLRSGEVDAVLAAGPSLLDLVRSPDPAQRREAVRALHDAGPGGLHGPLRALLADPDEAVAREALRAAGAVRHPRLWRPVVDALARPELRGTAERALEAASGAALDAVAAALRTEPGSVVATALLQTCARFGPPAVRVVLAALPWALDAPQRRVGDAAVEALRRLGQPCTDAEAALVLDVINRDLDVMAGLAVDRAAIEGLGRTPSPAALVAACDMLQERLAFGLSERWALLPDPRPDTVAREIAAVVAARDAGTRRSALAARLPTTRTTVTEALHRLLLTGERDHPLLAGLALHVAADARPDLLAGLGARVGADAAPLVAETARILLTDPREPAMTPIERLLALRGCDVLADADDDSLAVLAEQASERVVEPGVVLFTRGDPPDAVHLVVDGVVELGQDGRTRLVGPGELAGELAICDRQAFSATAVVREPGSVLVIPAAAFEELLAASPAVTRELLRRIARRARAAESGVAVTDDAMASILDRLADPQV